MALSFSFQHEKRMKPQTTIKNRIFAINTSSALQLNESNVNEASKTDSKFVLRQISSCFRIYSALLGILIKRSELLNGEVYFPCKVHLHLLGISMKRTEVPFWNTQQLQCGGKTVCMQSLKETVSGIAELLPSRIWWYLLRSETPASILSWALKKNVFDILFGSGSELLS